MPEPPPVTNTVLSRRLRERATFVRSMDRPLRLANRLLQALAVERLRAESRRVDAIETTDVHGKHLATVLGLGAGERLDTAVATEKVVNDPSVELVVEQVVLAREQGELLRGCKGKPKPVFGAF